MACLIESKDTGKFLKKNKISIERGFFQTEEFFESFGGDWTKGEVKFKDSARWGQVNKDLSPKIVFNPSKSRIFYLDKNRNRINIPIVTFASIPVDDRAEISYAVSDAIMYELQKELQLDSASFNEISSELTLEEFYDEVRDQILSNPEEVSEVIQESLNRDKDDYIKLIRDRLKGLGIKYSTTEVIIDKEGNEITPEEREELAEENDGDYSVVQKPSYERSAAKSANSEIKFMLEFLPEMKADGSHVESGYIPGAATLMDPSRVFAILLENISNIPSLLKDPSDSTRVREGDSIGRNSVQEYLNKLEELIPRFPWIRSLVDTLNNLPEEHRERFQLEFVSVFASARNHIYTYEISNGKYSLKDTSETGKDTVFLIRDWAELINQKLFSGEKTVEASKTTILNLVDGIVGNITNFTENAYKDRANRDNLDYNIGKIFELTSPLFEYIDMGIDEDVFKNYINTAIAGGTGESVNQAIKAAGDKAIALVGKFKNIANSEKPSDVVKYTKAKANLMPALAEAYSNIYIPIADYMATVGQKRIYLYSLPTVLQRQIDELRENPEILDAIKKDVKSLNNSVWLEAFRENPEILNRLKVGLRGQTQLEGKAVDGADNKNVKKADYTKGEIFAALRKSRFGNDPVFATQIPADKGREYQLNPGIFLEFDSMDDVYKVFKGYVKDEIMQMYEAHQEIQNEISVAIRSLEEKHKVVFEELEGDEKQIFYMNAVDLATNGLVIGYHLDKDGKIMDQAGQVYTGDAFKFRLFPSLNPKNSKTEEGPSFTYKGIEFMKNMYDMIVQGQFDPNNFEALLNKQFDHPTFETGFRNHLMNSLENILFNEKQYLKDLKIEYTDDSENPAYTSIDSEVATNYHNKLYKEGADNVNVINNAIMRDYIFNAMVAKIEYAKLFTGALQYYKSDQDYIKRVPATYIDGKPLMTGLTDGDLNFKIMTFSTEKITDSILLDSDLSREVKNYYRGVDRTDAQGWITPERWEFILRRTGKMNRDNGQILRKLKNQWKALEKGNKISEEDQLTPNEYKVLSAQPLKGVYFKNDYLHGPLYVKYSQAVLIPSMMISQPKMKALYEYMKKNGVDEAVADSGVKVGSLKANNLHENFVTDKDGNMTLSLPNARFANLDNRNWRLQQDLPTKTVKDNKIGTQIQKIIISGLRTMKTTEPIIGNYTPAQLADAIDNALSDLSDIGVEKIKKEYGVKKDYKIESLEKFYEPILKDMEAEGIPFLNLKDALESDLPLAALPHIRKQVISNFMSKLKKAATNLLTPGGGFIQVSDHLISLAEIKSKGGITMLMEDSELEDRLQPPNVIEENGRKIVIPGQVLIPHKFIAKLIPNYTELTPTELKEQLPKDVLQIIGYRIPTQSRASTDLLEVVGILPPEAGDSIITYGEITSKTGSDFDIDKMFFMMPELEMHNGKVRKVPYETTTTVTKQVESTKPTGTINVYWGQAESATSTKLLSNLSPREFKYKGEDYMSVEHAYQVWKTGTKDQAVDNRYRALMAQYLPTSLATLSARELKMRGKGTVAQLKAANSLDLMKELVVESFKQNKNSAAAEKLLQYGNFTHNTTTPIDRAFLEGLKLAQSLLTEGPATARQVQVVESSAALEVGSSYISDDFAEYVIDNIAANGDITATNRATETTATYSNNAFKELVNFVSDTGFSMKISEGGKDISVTDVHNTGNKTEDGKPIFSLETNLVDENDIGKGLGKATYLEAIKEVRKRGGVLTPGNVVKGNKVWESFNRDGLLETIKNSKGKDITIFTQEERETVSEVSEKGMRNKVFDLFAMALSSPALYESMMTSIDNDTTEVMVKSIVPSKVTRDLHVFTPSIAIETRFNLKAGQSGIGDMVNANNDHTRSQGRDIKFDVELGNWGNDIFDEAESEYLDDTLDLNDPNVSLVLREILKTQYPKMTDYELAAKEEGYLSNINNRKISDVLSELTNAFVDIANKDAFITKANWGALTNTYGTMLLRSGVHPLKVFSMIRNPAISALLKQSSVSEGIIYHENIIKIKEGVRKDLVNKFDKLMAEASLAELKEVEELDTLTKIDIATMYMSAKRQSLETLKEVKAAILIYDHFLDNTEVTRKYGRAVTTAKVGENGVGKGFGSYIVLTNKLTDAMTLNDQDLGFSNLEKKYYDDDLNKTLLMKFHENTVGLLEQLAVKNQDIFGLLTDANVEQINSIYSDSTKSALALNDYNIDRMFDAMNTLLLSSFTPFTEEYTEMERKELEDKFFEIRKTNDYLILNKIFTKKNEDDSNIEFFSNKVNLLSNKNKNLVVSSWSKLLKDHKDLGEFLIRESFNSHGFQSKLGSFHEMIPYRWFIDNKIMDHVRKNTKVHVPTHFAKQLAVNELGPSIFNTYTKMTQIGNGIAYTEDGIGKFKTGDKYKKFPKFTQDKEGDMYMFLGKRNDFVVLPNGKELKTIYGIYKQLPKVPKNRVIYSPNEHTFGMKLGIKPIEDYVQEFKMLPSFKKYPPGVEHKSGFIPVEEGLYEKDRVKRVNIITEYESKVEARKQQDNGDLGPTLNEPKCK